MRRGFTPLKESIFKFLGLTFLVFLNKFIEFFTLTLFGLV